MARKPIAKIGKYSLGKLKSRKQWCVQWHDGATRPRYILPNLSVDCPQIQAEAALELWVRAHEAASAQDVRWTCGRIMDAYISDRENEGKRSVKTMRHNWTALKTTFEHLQPADLRTVVEVVHIDGKRHELCHCKKYALGRSQGGIARDTINTELNRLRTAIKWAVATKKIAEPPKGKDSVWVPPPGKARDIVLDEDEFFAIFHELRMPHVRLTVVIAMGTGARKEAIRELKWPQVNFKRRQIDFNRQERQSILDSSHLKGRAIVDMNNWVYAALEEAYEWRRSDYVIEYRGKSAGDVKKAIQRAVIRAGLGGRRIGLHTLRHTLATWAAEKNVPLRKIQRMLGHDNIKSTGRYSKHRGGYTREAVEAGDIRGQLPLPNGADILS